MSSYVDNVYLFYVYEGTYAETYAKKEKYNYFIREPLLDKIQVKNPKKLEYIEGEIFDGTGIEVTAFYHDGTTKLISDYEIKKPKIETGIQRGFISYKGFHHDFTIKVYPKKISSVKVVSKKRKTVTITWSKVKGADSYRIYRSSKKNGKYNLKKKVGAKSKRSFIDKKLKSKKSYIRMQLCYNGFRVI